VGSEKKSSLINVDALINYCDKHEATCWQSAIMLERAFCPKSSGSTNFYAHNTYARIRVQSIVHQLPDEMENIRSPTT
jgi:hypothetical protein